MSEHKKEQSPKSDSDAKVHVEQDITTTTVDHSQDADRHLKIRHPVSDK